MFTVVFELAHHLVNAADDCIMQYYDANEAGLRPGEVLDARRQRDRVLFARRPEGGTRGSRRGAGGAGRYRLGGLSAAAALGRKSRSATDGAMSSGTTRK